MTMSCRIDRVVNSESLVVLFVSGCVQGEHVDMLRGVLEQESGGSTIDLKNVLLVDREAVKLLALSEANRTELRNCPPYIREWVTRGRADVKEERGSKMFKANRDGLDRHLHNARSKVVVDRTPAISGLIGFSSSFLDVMETSCLQRTSGALR